MKHRRKSRSRSRPLGVSRRGALAALLLAAGAVSGCKTVGSWVGLVGPAAFDVVVSLDETSFPELNASIEVDVVPVTNKELELWASFPVDEYFQPKGYYPDIRARFLQKERLRRLHFKPDAPGPHTVSRSDPFWEPRLEVGAEHLLIIADLPLNWAGKPAAQDPRRSVLPLERSRWDDCVIEVQLTRLGIDLVTHPSEEE